MILCALGEGEKLYFLLGKISCKKSPMRLNQATSQISVHSAWYVLGIKPEVFSSPQLLCVWIFFRRCSEAWKLPTSTGSAGQTLKIHFFAKDWKEEIIHIFSRKKKKKRQSKLFKILVHEFVANQEHFWHAFGLLQDVSICAALNKRNKCQINYWSMRDASKIKSLKEHSSLVPCRNLGEVESFGRHAKVLNL